MSERGYLVYEEVKVKGSRAEGVRLLAVYLSKPKAIQATLGKSGGSDLAFSSARRIVEVEVKR